MSNLEASEGATAQVNDRAAFEELCDRVVAGEQLPQTIELVRGSPFFRDDITADANAFATQMLDQMEAQAEDGEALLFALAELTAELTVNPGTNDFLIAAHAFEALVGEPEGVSVPAGASAGRCRFYAAISGDRRSWNHVAAYAVEAVHASPASDRDQAVGAIAWLLVSTGQRQAPCSWTRSSARALLASVEASPGPGRIMVDRMLRSRCPEQTIAVTQSACLGTYPAGRVEGPDEREADSLPSTTNPIDVAHEEQADAPYHVVITQIGNAESSEGRRIAAEFQPLVGRGIPLAPVPDLEHVRRRLLNEFPHAITAVDAVLDDLSGRPFVKLSPMLFVGAPGCGKTTFATRVAELLGLPTVIYPCGSASDGAIAGTPRRWGTAEPSLPVSVIRANRHAGPCIVLDELDKAASSRINGSLQDALVAFLAPETARHFRDPYVEAPVDLTAVVWFATANTVQDVSRAVCDRLRIVRVPSPCADHIEILANTIMLRLTIERGWHPQWATHLEGWELAALAAAWPGGSLRSLERMVRAVWALREHADAVH